MSTASVAALLLDVLHLVKAGFALKQITEEVKNLEAEGATHSEISAYLKGLRDSKLAQLREGLNQVDGDPD